jgi:hypothetical protein
MDLEGKNSMESENWISGFSGGFYGPWIAVQKFQMECTFQSSGNSQLI